MKFGKRMRALAASQWEAHYVDYKQQKKQIKALQPCACSGAEAPCAVVKEYWSKLELELEKVNDAYKQIGFDIQQHELARVQRGLGDRWVLKASTARALLLDILECAHTIDAFRRFVVLNSLAFVKITKKFDKLTGHDLKPHMLSALKEQAFYDGYLLDELCAQTSALMDRLMLCVLPDGYFHVDDEAPSCPICLSAMMKNPITLSCAHTFCWSCLSKAAEHQFNACPMCRKEQSIDPRDYEIDGLIKRFKRVYSCVERGLHRFPHTNGAMRLILSEAFQMVDAFLQEVDEQYAALTPLARDPETPAPFEDPCVTCDTKLIDTEKDDDFLSLAKGDPVEVLYGDRWCPGMVLECNDNRSYSVLYWVDDNSQRFGHQIYGDRLRIPILTASSGHFIFDIAAGAWKLATEWALSPFRRLRSLSFSDTSSCHGAQAH